MQEDYIIYREIIQPEYLHNMEIEIEISKIKSMEIEKKNSNIIRHFDYHTGTGDFTQDILLGQLDKETRNKYVIDYTINGKDRPDFDNRDKTMTEKVQDLGNQAKENLDENMFTFSKAMRNAFQAGKEFLNS